MRKTNLKKLAAVVLSAAMVLSMGGMTAFADNKPVEGGTANAKITKYLIMDEGANVPNATFSYEIEAATAVDGEGLVAVYATSTTPKVLVGVDADKVVIGTTTFTPEDQPLEEADDFVTLGEKEKYAKKKASINFSEVTFENPGIYRYVITEVDPTEDGITKVDNKLYLDVYVITDEDAQLSISDYILHKTDAVADTTSGGFQDSLEKTTGFVNRYETENLTLKKTVTGNQGNRNEYFKFNVTIENAAKGTVYTVVLPTTDCDSRNKDTIIIPDSGSTTVSYYLKSDQEIKIQGLTAATKYTIEEDIKSTEGYTTSYKLGESEAIEALTTGEQSMGDGNSDDVEFINDKKVTTPTGIALTFAPYALLVALAGVFGFFFLRKKREDEV